MHLKLCILFLFSLSFFISNSQEHIQLKKKAEQQYNNNQIEEALVTCRKALQFAELNVGKNHVDYAELLNDIGTYLFSSGKYADGISSIEAAKELFKKVSVEKSSPYVVILTNLATAYSIMAEYDKAEEVYTNALSIKKELKQENDTISATLLTSFADVQKTKGEFKKAEANLIHAKQILENNNLKQSLGYGSVLNTLASLYHDLGNYLNAEPLYKQALQVFKNKEGESGANYGIGLQNIGELYVDMGAYEQAGKYFEQARKAKLIAFGVSSYEYSTLLNDIANLSHKTGEYMKSEILYREALKIKKETIGEKHSSYIRTQNNIAMLYADMGRKKEATDMLELLLEKIKKNKEEHIVNYADYSGNLGAIYAQTKKYIQAEKLLKEQLEIYKKIYGENHMEYIRTLNNLAYLYSEKGEIDPAEKYYLQCIETDKKNNNSNLLESSKSLLNLGILYKNAGQLQKAEMYVLQANETIKNLVNTTHPLFLDCQFELANIYADLNRNTEAEKIYMRVLDIYLNKMNHAFAYMTENERSVFYEDFNTRLGNFYAFAAHAHLTDATMSEKICDYRLATKGILFNSYNKLKENLYKSGDARTIEEYENLKSKRNYLSKLYSLTNGELVALKINIDSLQQDVDNTEKNISSKSEMAKKLTAFRHITWKDIRDKLDADEVAVEIIRSDRLSEESNYGVIIITKEDKRPLFTMIPEGNKLETEYLAAYRNSIQNEKTDTMLFQAFLKKIILLAGMNKKIYFSADGVYNQVNLSTIMDPLFKEYIIDAYKITQVTSLVDILELKEKKKYVNANVSVLFGYPDYSMDVAQKYKNYKPDEEDNLLAINVFPTRAGKRWSLSDLPGTKIEVEEINKIFSNNKFATNLFLGQQADELTLKKIKNPFVLHIATHGYFEENSPRDSSSLAQVITNTRGNSMLRSGIMLAGASNSYSVDYKEAIGWQNFEDGVLTAYEAMNLSLDSTELVVLSACQTGLGVIKNGEGVYGLQRAFLMAGAKSVIMSLWSVSDDATRDLMILFYDRWLKTGDKHKAFYDAQIELRKKYPQPYYWGAFVLLER